MTNIEPLYQLIRERGDIPFVEYMQQVLYSPQFGYYSTGRPKFGAQGDFTTAPELTPLFGQTIAHQCRQVLATLPDPIIFEFGAGSGRLCVDVLTTLEALKSLPREYHILELSGDLKKRQQQVIEESIPHLASRVRWHDQWPDTPFNGVVLANEVLDAMPVHRFMQTQDDVLESYITLNEQGQLHEIFKSCTNPRLKAHVKDVLAPDLYPYQSEANLFLDDWFQQCFNMLEKGAFFILDYGFPRHEYYHPDRKQGTIMCHHQHQSHADFLAYPGEQDITAHVEFTHVAQAAFNAGFHVAGFCNQASFLLANGLLSLLSDVQGERKRIQEQFAAKLLLQESEMGELFKVMGLLKHVDLALTGFQMQDKRASL